MNLYINPKTVVKIQQELSGESEIGRDVRQGCCMSPLLFNIYAEAMMLEAMDGVKEGVRIGGKLLKDVRFEDDQAMVVECQAGFQKIVNSLHSTANKISMKINKGESHVST